MDTNYDGDGPEFLIPGVRIVRASRKPCPICGHATGDCVGTGEPPHTIFADKVRLKTPQPQPTVLVEEDIFGERQITPFTRARVLLAAKGTYVTQERAQELGLL